MHKAEKSADGETFTDIKYNESNTSKMEIKKKMGKTAKILLVILLPKIKKGNLFYKCS